MKSPFTSCTVYGKGKLVVASTTILIIILM